MASATVVRYLPVAFICLIFLILWFIYDAYHLVPMLQLDMPAKAVNKVTYYEGIFWIFAFHAIIGMFMWSYAKAIATDPGRIPAPKANGEDDWARAPEKLPVTERKADGNFRFCKVEQKYKPDRAHLCRPLGHNVLRMDHYCPWLGNCVGYHNQKYFFLTLVYAEAALLIVFFSVFQSVSFEFSDSNVTFGTIYMLLLGAMLSGFMLVILTPFFGMHVMLVLYNMTTIEFCEKFRSGTKPNPYDLGFYKNIQAVLGEHFYTWLIPLYPPQGDGIHFERNEFAEQMLLPTESEVQA